MYLIVPYFCAHGHGRMGVWKDAKLVWRRVRAGQRRDAEIKDEQKPRLHRQREKNRDEMLWTKTSSLTEHYTIIGIHLHTDRYAYT